METSGIYNNKIFLVVTHKVASLKKLIDNRIKQFISTPLFISITTPKFEGGKLLNRPKILGSSFQSKILNLCVRALYGVATLKSLTKDALVQMKKAYPRAYPGVLKKLKTQSKDREKRTIDGARQFQNGQLPLGYFDEASNQISGMPKMNHFDLAALHCESLKDSAMLNEIRSGDGNTWEAVRINKNEITGAFELEKGKINPTSEKGANISNGLNNIYIHCSDAGHLTITCGVIDTKEKADHFIAAIEYAQEKYDGSLRINMHQLNSMGSGPAALVSEHALVTKQHKMARYINQQLKEKYSINTPIVTHVNRCLNGFTQVPGEDEKSHSINREGIATQMSWLLDDLVLPELESKHTKVNQTLQKLNSAQVEVDQIEDILNAFKSSNTTEIEKIQAEINRLNFSIRDVLVGTQNLTKEELNFLLGPLELYSAKVAQIFNIDMSNPNQLEDFAKVSSTEMTLSDFLNKHKLRETDIKDIKLYAEMKERYAQIKSSIKKHERQLDEDLIDLASEMNKVKPIDKEAATKIKIASSLLAMQTGRAGREGYPSKLSPAQELSYQLLLDHILGTVTEINCKSGLDRTGFARSLQNALQQKLKMQPLDHVFEFIKDFESNVKKMDDGDIIEVANEVIDFQQKVFAELMGVAMPITGRSTGLEGLKWHHDKNSLNPFEKNFHPLPYIPRQVTEDGTNTEIKLITIDKKGKSNLSHAGNILLMRLSARRGG